MRFLSFFFIIVFQLGLINAIKIKCSQNDGFYAIQPDTRCETYYRCTSKAHFEMKGCTRGEIFNISNQKCSRTTDECAEPSCDGRVNGVYPDLTHACRRYYTCFGGKVTTIDHCSARHLHNGFKCVHEEQYRCPAKSTSKTISSTTDNQLCKGKPNGPSVDPTSSDCTAYIFCHNDQFEHRELCSEQAVFNGMQCVPAPLYKCPAVDRPTDLLDNPCTKLKNGLHAHPQHGCSAYFRCLSRKLVELNHCKYEKYFDPDLGKCIMDYMRDSRRCQDVGISADCLNKHVGLYKSEVCNKYYYCHANRKVEYTCSAGKVFNGQICVPQSEYSCNEPHEVCQNHENGYFKDAQDGCRSYKFCFNGNKITYLCDKNYVFDAKSKKCVPDNNGYCAENSICSNKSDGYHANVQENCRQYVFCQNQENIVQLTCRANYVFNGQKCVPAAQYACPSLYNHKKINCLPQHCLQGCERDGLFVDLTTDCRNYYFCISGNVSKLECPSGRRFNGELCVPEDQFTCPSVCTAQIESENSHCVIHAYNYF